MSDFISSLYLGMKHDSTELKTWNQLTTGMPAGLYETVTSKKVGATVAAMQGLESGICAPSTMHIYSDLFGLLSKKRIKLFIDEKIYPVSRYGIEKLSVAGIKVLSFNHLDAAHLQRMVDKNKMVAGYPVVMTDGWCPVCGRASPVNDYSNIVRPYGGRVIIDDTQAFGILGKRPNSSIPYGNGGGGILKWLNVHDANIVTVVSLAKAFGVPMAIISGSNTFISAFRKKSETRIHSSPVSTAHLHAALNALFLNQQKGDKCRAKLWQHVRYVRKQLMKMGIKPGGGIFPVQHISGSLPDWTIKLSNRLEKDGIRTVLTAAHDEQQPVVSFMIRYDHTAADIASFVASVEKEILYPQLY
ncbi:MAG TPA: aminotransferase class I/II-fold pyridoxal phosphate-dependent enzyme [Chitinophagaceae bacterium]